MSTERIEVPADPEVFAAFLDANKANSEGSTTKELMKIWKCSKAKALRHLEAARDMGALRHCVKQHKRLDGIVTLVPAYTFVLPKKNGKKP